MIDLNKDKNRGLPIPKVIVEVQPGYSRITTHTTVLKLDGGGEMGLPSKRRLRDYGLKVDDKILEERQVDIARAGGGLIVIDIATGKVEMLKRKDFNK
jgi:hypothetical protein